MNPLLSAPLRRALPWLAALLLAAPAVTADTWPSAATDTVMTFTPDSTDERERLEAEARENESEDWLRAPFGDDLLTHPDAWRYQRGTWDDRRKSQRVDLTLDYNRVDLLRLGMRYQAQQPETMSPRVAGRIEYSEGRDRTLYGVQFEQPLLPPARVAAGVSMVRRTDHSDLQQVDDTENSLALLFGRQDYRDYFEREGFGGYLSWRVPDFSTVSVHVRRDRWRSLERADKVRSWFNPSRTLRANPAIDDGETNRALFRLERLAHRTRRTRSGLYHWIELEKAGGSLGGDFSYARGIADVRSVVRLSPAATLAVRAVAGTTTAGVLPRQREFTVGGVDGLRAHAFSSLRGDQMALGQAEYSVGLWHFGSEHFDSGLQALAFVDAGTAWQHAGEGWDVGRQQAEVDGGFGIATSDDNLRVYFAKDLKHAGSDFVISLRLQRPF